MALVTISRQFGAGGLLLGERVCKKIGFRLIDEGSLNDIARNAKVSPDWLEAVEKEAASNALYLLSSIVSKGIFYRTPGLPSEEVERKKYIDTLTKIMKAMAEKGGYVIIGRGSQFILQDYPRSIHILLISEYEKRVRLVAETFKISDAKAMEMIREKEKERSALATHIFKKNMDDPSYYHLVINTGKVPLESAVEIVSAMTEDRISQERQI